MLRKLSDASQKTMSQWLLPKEERQGCNPGYSQIRTDPGKPRNAENPGTKPEKFKQRRCSTCSRCFQRAENRG